MKKISINDLICENKILMFFLDERKSTKTILLRHFFVFFAVPILLFIISLNNGILFVAGVDTLGHNKVGMMEDFLFFAFALGTAQLSLIILRIILKRFIVFIREIPSFTKDLDPREYDTLIDKSIRFVASRHLFISLIKFFYITTSLYTNCIAHWGREDGWNSAAHPYVFGVWLIVLILTVGTVLPQTIGKFLVVIASQIRLTKELERNDQIKVQPIDPDKAGGLKSLGELSLSFTYFLVPFMFQIIMHTFTWKIVTLGFIIGVSALIPLTFFVFFYPLSVVHKAMAETKHNTLKEISQAYVEMNHSVMVNINDAIHDKFLTQKKEMVELLDIFYEKANEMPVWPFNTKTITRFLALGLGPAIIVLLEVIFNQVLSKLIK